MEATANLEQRIVVLAPTGRDAPLACGVLGEARMTAQACSDVRTLCRLVEEGVGAVLIAEEALTPDALGCLAEVLKAQPAWSDLPIVIFASAVPSRAATARLERTQNMLGNVTFVDRPVRVATLITAMKAALRARARQYSARQLLQLLEAKEEEARRRVDFEQQLIGIVSHDLKNPLSAVLFTASSLLRREGLDERTTLAAVRLQSSAERAIRMVKDLLDFTQARLGGGIPVKREPVDLHQIVEQVVDEIQLSYPDRFLLLRRSGAAQGSWDADRLAQAISNLVLNAVKYSPPNSRVSVEARDDGDAAIVEVHNTGDPISAELLPRIFNPLQRGTVDTDKMGRSIGLGLFIVKSIVDAHGGTIDAASSPQQGTTFTLRLPRTA